MICPLLVTSSILSFLNADVETTLDIIWALEMTVAMDSMTGRLSSWRSRL